MVLAMTVALSSCDDFLDEMPDNRTELDTEAKITRMLVSAYPETNYALLAEMSSDNEMCIRDRYETVPGFLFHLFHKLLQCRILQFDAETRL